MKLYTYTMDNYGRGIILSSLSMTISYLQKWGSTELQETALREAILVYNEIMNLSEDPKQNTLAEKT